MKHDSIFLARWCERLAVPYRHPASAVVVAIATGDDVHVVYDGLIDAAHPHAPTATTLFEIGSVTKVFTAVLLASLALDGRVDLDRPLSTQVAGFDSLARWITPRSLATHTSGLPRIPAPWWAFPFLSPVDPYAAFTARDLVRWMRRYSRRPAVRRPDDQPRYSNLGVGLLGFALGRIAGSDYASALRAEVLRPLALDDTTIELDEARLARFATPHRSNGTPTSAWHFDALAGAGALRSSAADLAAFARAIFAAVNDRGPLAAAIRATLEVQLRAPDARSPAQCLGWSLLPCPRLSLAVHAHEGSTLGSSCAFYVVPRRELAVIVLSNRGLSLSGSLAVARSQPLGIIEEILATEGAGSD